MFLAVGIFLAWLIYNLFFKSEQEPYVIIDGKKVPVGQLPQIAEGLPEGVVIDPETGLPVIGGVPTTTSALSKRKDTAF